MSFTKFLIAVLFALVLNLLSFTDVSQENVVVGLSDVLEMEDVTASVQLDLQSDQLLRLQNDVNTFIKFWNIQGASLAVAKEGEIIYNKGFGLADTAAHQEVEPKHMFRLASLSKLITAVAVMQLVEEGELSLEDHVFGRDGVLNFPPYRRYTDKKIEEIKVKHLLEHSGGWTQYYGDPMFNQGIIAKRLGKNRPLTSEEIIAYMLYKRLHFKPGTASHYSNLGFTILGKVIEAASGMDYEMYVKTHILQPIGIYDMYLGKNRMQDWMENEVHYYEQPDAIKVSSVYDHNKLARKCDGGKNMEALGAAGQWIGSAQSMLKLVLTIDGDQKPFDILSKESIHEMTYLRTNGFSPYGWRKTRSNGEWIRTGTLAGSTCLIEKGADGLTYVVLCNTSPWRGSDFPYIMKRFMDKELKRVEAFRSEAS